MGTILLILMFLPAAAVPASPVLQQGSAEVRGVVSDETGAVITSAKVALDDGQGHKYAGQSDQQGNYRINGILPGKYTLNVQMDGFATFTQPIDLTEKRLLTVNAPLKVVITEEQVVKDSAPAISTEPDQNLSAITLSGADLEALPDDPDDMLTVLREMAGATEDATVYVDGFQEGGRLPPKEAILAIRINSNPFAAEYSEPGFGRIEIITKPGTSAFHGGLRFNFNDSAFNARNAFANTKPPLRLEDYNVFLSGPIIRNRWDFFFDFERRNLSQDSVINAIVLDPTTLQPVPFVSTIVAPSTITNFSFRTNYLLTKSTTIGLWYRFTENNSSNQGLSGGFDLPERAFNTTSRDNTLRFTLTNVLNERSVNQVHAELSRRSSGSQAVNDAPAVNVVQAFSSGGNQGSLFSDNVNQNLNFKDDLTYSHNKHSFKFGMAAYGTQYNDTNQSNFGGTFTFQSDVQRDASGNPILNSNGSTIPISAIEHYRLTLLGAPGYHPSQFTITTGDPFVGFTQWQMAWYAQDDWRLSQRLTVSYGLRHEFQNHLDAKFNLAPRFGLAWQPDKARKSTIRVGAGIFYTGLAASVTSSAISGDGIHQQHLIINEPEFFPNVPAQLTGFTSTFSTIQLKGPGLSDPYTIITNVSYDRQLPLKLLGSVGYTYERGVHLLRSRDLNEADPVTGILPNPGLGPVLQFESSGLMRRNELKVSLRTGFSGKISVWANYILSQTNTDTDGAGSIPASSFDLATEYGRASYDQRHRFFIGSSILAPWQVRISPFIFAGTGRPFNITTGQDTNHDLLFTDRPAFATAGQTGAIVTPFGVFNPNPTAGEVIIPRNFGDGPSSFSVNLGFTKTFGFGQAPQSNARGERRGGGPGGPGGDLPRVIGGPGGEGGGRGGFGGGGGRGGFGGAPASRYTLTVGLFAQNLINHTNLGNFNGVLTSPLFGLANTAQAGRRITLSARFNF